MLKVIASSQNRAGARITLMKKISDGQVRYGAFVEAKDGNDEGEWVKQREQAASEFDALRAPGARISA